MSHEQLHQDTKQPVSERAGKDSKITARKQTDKTRQTLTTEKSPKNTNSQTTKTNTKTNHAMHQRKETNKQNKT